MIKKSLTVLPVLASLLLSPALFAEEGTTVTEETSGRVKTQTIATQDRYGTIEEQRVQAMYSEIHYRPASGSDGYSLIGAGSDSSSVKSAHSDSDELMIPSWKVLSW